MELNLRDHALWWMLSRRLAVAVLALWIITYCLSCSGAPPPTSTTPSSAPLPAFTTKIGLGYYQEIPLEEASTTLETSLAPTYLPSGLKIQEVYTHYYPEEDRVEVILFISDEKIEKKLVTSTKGEGIIRLYHEFECKMKMTIRQAGPPIRMGEKVKVNYGTGRIMVGDETQSLYWYVGRIELILKASKDTPREELVKVAESVSL